MRGNRSTAVSIPVSPYKHAGIHARYLAALAAVILTLWSAPPVMCAFINPPILHDELTYSLDGGSSYAHRGSAIWKNVAYLSGWPTDAYDPIYSIDVSDPDNLTYIGRSGGPGYYYNQMFPLEDKLYVAGWGEMLRDYSISNPGYPVYLGQYDRPCEPDPNNPGENICYFGWGVRAVDNRVYLTEASEKSKGLYIIDVSNPSGPTEVSRLELDESPGGIAARGSYLYFGYNHFGSIPAANYFSFKVANISDETNPYVISTINLTSIGSVGDIVLRGDIAYVSNNGITTIDISDPANPTVISHWDYVGGQLLLLGDYAFVATGGNGCIFVNIADPANMYGVYTVYHGSPREYEEAVVGNGRYVYVGTTSNKLVQDPPYNVLHSFEVFTSDPDNAGPGNCKEFSPREASWESQYDADVMPTAAGWTVHEGSEASASISSGVLRINDTGSGDVKWRKGWDATNTRGSTIVFKARCDSYNLNGQPEANLANVFIEDGKYQEQFAILTNKIRVCNATLDEAAVTPGVWHTYRITTQQGLFNLYIDENPTPAISRPLYETTPRSRIMFGVGSGAASQDISFDYFYYFSNGVFPPPQVLTTPTPDVGVRISEIAGKGSLSGINPTTARVHWSTDTGATWSTSILGALWDDHYGGTTLPSAATPVWTVAEGSESWATLEPGVAHVIDNSMASGSKIKWSRAWGITPSTGATVLARIKCDSVGGDMTYLGNIYVDDGVKHERFKVTPTSISAANSGYTYNLNATQWHTYRITIRNSQFKVYVDESPTAVLSASMIANTEGNGSRVMFGSGASAATQSIYFDYVRYTVDGEFTPGSGPSAATLAVACDGRDADDRCYISAGGLPLIYSKTRNKVKFSLMDKMGNIGYSPVYSLSILSPTAPGQVTNFSAVAGAGQISLSWTNPADPWFTGTMIRYKTSGYPTGPTDGTLLCDRSTAPGANDGYLHTGLGNNTYYYAAYSHDETPNYSSGTIASATPGCVAVWLDEIFDNYNNGNLGGQGAWTTTGAASAQAQSGYAESGKAALMDTIASGGAAIANRIAFDAKSGGYHYLTLDVSQDA
ncbi:MAG: hypothetical protein Q7T82_17595, partial [Armatimonadota bacterium]|nr:hypothetical protein [Armatimonadota bacterium]